MDWLVLLIPVVAVGIWGIINAMNKGAEAQRNMPPQARPAGRPRSATAEIDRFLEEVNRRRQQQQQRQATRREQPRDVEAVEVEVDVPPPPPVRPRPVVVQPRPRPVVPPPVRRPVAQPEIVIQAVEQPYIPVAQPVPAAVFQTPPPLAAMRVSRPVPAHLQELRGLLRSPKGLRTAFILNEIFGTPRCRRPHQR